MSDKTTIEVDINNEKAKTAIKELTLELKNLRKERYEAVKAGDSEKVAELMKKESEVAKKRATEEEKLADVRKTLANITTVSIKELTKAQDKLRKEIFWLHQGTDEYIEKQKQLKKIEEQLAITRWRSNKEQIGFMGSIKQVWGNVMPFAGLAGVITAVAAGTKALISDIWTLSKTIQGDSKRAAQVFGDELGYVEMQADKLSKKMGVTNMEFVSMTTNVADLLIPLDFSRDRAAKMAVDVQKLAGALNEWTSGKFGVADVSDKLTKAMLGETEGLKSLGIAIRMDSEEYKNLVKQKEAEGAASTAQAQALAILDLLYKKSADAQAAYNSSGNDLLRFQNSASRGWREMKESMAEWFATTKQERIEKLARTYHALNQEFNNNEATLDRLLPVYNDLSSKTNRNENEQQQLRDAIDGIVSIVPQATNGIDEYGKALGVNTKIVSIAREAQRLLRIEMQQKIVGDLIDQAQTGISELEKAIYRQIRAEGALADKQRNNGKTIEKGKLLDAERVIAIQNATNETYKYEQQLGRTIVQLRELGLTSSEISNLINTTFELNRNFKTTSEFIDDIENKFATSLKDKQIKSKEAEIKDLEEELSKLTDKMQKANKEAQIAKAQGELKQIKGETEVVVGIIEAKEKKLKELKDGLSKLTTDSEIAARNKEISKLEAELKKYKEAGVPKENKKTWSLDNDKAFFEARAALREKMLKGDIATEEEFNAQVLALEISHLAKRITANKDKGEELLKIKGTLQEKQLQQEKVAKAERQKLLDLIDTGKSDLERAKIEYDKQLIAYKLFTKEQLANEEEYRARMAELTDEQLHALRVISTKHNLKVAEIQNKAIADRATKELEALERSANQQKIAQNNELRSLTTLSEKKAWLVNRFGYERIEMIRTAQEADKALTKEYARENEEATRTSLEKLKRYYSVMLASIIAVNPMKAMFNQSEIKEYQDIIAKLEAELAKIVGKSENTKPKADDKVDILGMTGSQWEEMFANTNSAATTLEKVLAVASAIGQAFSDVNNLLVAMEQREFKSFEKTQNAKKKSLDKRLKSGIISQEAYNNQSQLIDSETDLKREEMERKQAERAKALAVFQALINTATGVTAALSVQPPLGIILAGIVGALGAVQVATILATPVGFEDGGYVDVERAQDGKRFRARKEYDRRGYIDDPTLLVSENGRELVVPSPGVDNPTLRPMLDIVNASIERGDIRTFDFAKAFSPTTSKGYSNGKTSDTSPSDPTTPIANYGLDPEVAKELLSAIRLLNERLADRTPVPAVIAMGGRNGVYENYKKYEKQQNLGTI